MSWNLTTPIPSASLLAKPFGNFCFDQRLQREPTNSQTLVSSVTMVLTPAWTKRLKHTLEPTLAGCWHTNLFLGQVVIPPPQKKHINSYQRVTKAWRWRNGRNNMNKHASQNCWKKLFSLFHDSHSWLWLRMGSGRRHLKRVGRWLFLGSMFQSVNWFIHMDLERLNLQKIIPNKLLIVTRVFLSYQFLLFLNVTH